MLHIKYMAPPGFDKDGQCRWCKYHEWQRGRPRPYVEICGILTGDADNHSEWWEARKDLPLYSYWRVD